MSKIALKDLSYTVGNRAILRDISLDIAEGDFVTFIGKSGCGKTSLFKLVAGLLRPTTGEVRADGKFLSFKPGHISYMFQNDCLLEHMSCIDNVALPYRIKGMSKSDARSKVAPLLDKFQLSSYAHAWPHELSGGMRQRIALLRLYSMQNQIALLDEPFSALDAFTRREVRNWFYSIYQELHLTCCMVTHDVDEALLLANRVIVMQPLTDAVRTNIVADIYVHREKPMPNEFELTESFLAQKKELLKTLYSTA